LDLRTRSLLPLHATWDGIELRGRFRYRNFLHGVATRGYGRDVAAVISARLQPGWTFVDGGAHIGYYTIAAARLVGPTGHVIAFEPDPYNFAALATNARKFNYVKLREEALGAAPGSARFRRSRGTVSSSLLPRTGIGVTDEIEVLIRTVDEVTPGRWLRRVDAGGVPVRIRTPPVWWWSAEART
jgi:FkbM family methyltransferase